MFLGTLETVYLDDLTRSNKHRRIAMAEVVAFVLGTYVLGGILYYIYLINR